MTDASSGETRRQSPHVSLVTTPLELVVVQGIDVGLRATLDRESDKLLVGTSSLSEICLKDPTVSRRHASFEWLEEGAMVADLGSTNGTFVNDVRVRAAYLAADVRIRLGSTVFQVGVGPVRQTTRRRAASLGRMASASPRMMNALALAGRVAKSDMPVILEGETGTGKEFLAESIHDASLRAAQPFVVLDCRTTPRELTLQYLFGEVAPDGTFRAGILEQANGGTLLVDEPGDLSLDVQGQLLRAIDKGEIVRVGDTRPVTVSVRFIVATSKNLDKMVEARSFREDLYYRLAGTRIEVPPLRRRREDIPLLASELWTELGGKGSLPEEFLERFAAYDWPGNVRELEHGIERFLALGDKVSLAVNRTHRHVARPDLPARTGSGAGDDLMARVLRANLGYSEARQRVLDEFRKAYIEKALADSGGNVGNAAAASGIARRHFQRVRAK